jgi:hypothetical protein
MGGSTKSSRPELSALDEWRVSLRGQATIGDDDRARHQA